MFKVLKVVSIVNKKHDDDIFFKVSYLEKEKESILIGYCTLKGKIIIISTENDLSISREDFLNAVGEEKILELETLLADFV